MDVFEEQWMIDGQKEEEEEAQLLRQHLSRRCRTGSSNNRTQTNSHAANVTKHQRNDSEKKRLEADMHLTRQ